MTSIVCLVYTSTVSSDDLAPAGPEWGLLLVWSRGDGRSARDQIGVLPNATAPESQSRGRGAIPEPRILRTNYDGRRSSAGGGCCCDWVQSSPVDITDREDVQTRLTTTGSDPDRTIACTHTGGDARTHEGAGKECRYGLWVAGRGRDRNGSLLAEYYQQQEGC